MSSRPTQPTSPPSPQSWQGPTIGPPDEAPIDPAQVPVYPVIPIEVTADGQALVYGRPIEVPPELTPAQAAIAEAATEAAMLPGMIEAVRVAATGPDGQVWQLVVTGQGHVLDVTPQPEAPRPAWLMPAVVTAAVALLVGGVALGTGVFASAPAAPARAVPATVAAPLGAGANLPVPPPAGHSPRAAWSVAVSRRADPVVGPDGTIVALTSDGRLAQLDPATGRALWSIPAPAGVSDLHLTYLGGRLVLAAKTGDTITMWRLAPPGLPVDGPSAAALAAGTQVTIPKQGKVQWSPGSPLVVLPDQTGAIVTASGSPLLDIPVGATAAATDGSTVLALDDTGSWWHLTPGQPLPAPTRLTPPTGTAALQRVEALDVRTVLAIWATAAGPLAAVHDLSTGKITERLQLSLTVDLSSAKRVTSSDGRDVTLGPILARADRTLTFLGAGIRPLAVLRGHVYAEDDTGQLVDVQVTGRDVAIIPVPGEDPAVPLGYSPADEQGAALVTADKLDEVLLYSLPRNR